jgi:hypothetical protein
MNAKGFVVPPGGGSILNMAPSRSEARLSWQKTTPPVASAHGGS